MLAYIPAPWIRHGYGDIVTSKKPGPFRHFAAAPAARPSNAFVGAELTFAAGQATARMPGGCPLNRSISSFWPSNGGCRLPG